MPDPFRLRSDSWLETLLDRPAWRVIGAAEEGIGPSVLADGRRHFAWARQAVDDVDSLRSLEDEGFRLVDVSLTFETERPPPMIGAGFRFAQAADSAAVEDLAGRAFTTSRFHLDPRIGRPAANAIKSAWAGNWFRGERGHGMVVAEGERGEVVGFLLVTWSTPTKLAIDLIAVAPTRRGRGIGTGLIGFAACHGANDGRAPATMVVGTQAANRESVRFYEKLGFRFQRAEAMFHFHAPSEAA